VILLDTHVLVWVAEDDAKLGRHAGNRIERALRQDELAVSAFTFWEIAMLAAKGRLRLATPPAVVRRRALESGVREIPLTGDIAVAAAGLSGFHGDPADRIIAATALETEAILLTADRALLAWRGGLKARDARR
jgi:PIN domain nuclease of toxin-antitoxin system